MMCESEEYLRRPSTSTHHSSPPVYKLCSLAALVTAPFYHLHHKEQDFDPRTSLTKEETNNVQHHESVSAPGCHRLHL